MVFGKNEGKRKKKEGDNTVAAETKVVEPKPETPKRSKIYAQRKFAQGTNTSGFVTPTTTPVKDKEKTPSPVVFTESPHKKPSPGDFLTFLCYRGTSILPPSLDFLNGITSKENCSPFPKSEKSSNSPPQKTQKEKPTPPVKKPAVAKHQKAEVKVKVSTVQALKKKYQEQKLVKKLLKKNLKTSKLTKIPKINKTKSLLKDRLKKPEPKKSPIKTDPPRPGLRSTGFLDKEARALFSRQLLFLKPKKKPLKPKLKLVKKVVVEPKTNKTLVKLKKKVVKVETKKDKTAAETKKRITRSQNEVSKPAAVVNQRPSRKTKEAAAIYMEIIGRKLIDPDLDGDDDDSSLDDFPEPPKICKTKQSSPEVPKKGKKVEKVEKVEKTEKTEKIEKVEKIEIEKPKKQQTVVKPLTGAKKVESKPVSKPPRKGIVKSKVKKPIEPEKIPKKAVKEIQDVKKNEEVPKEKPVLKRKISEKAKKEPQKIDDDRESDEETLELLLKKIKSNIENVETEKPLLLEPEIKTNNVFAKMSDDEESFRGFSKESIIKSQVDPSILEKPLKIFEKEIKKQTPVAADPPPLPPPENPTEIEPPKIIDNMPRVVHHHSRKERVNMSTEQIEKWINESSLAKEESKVEMESISKFTARPYQQHLSISPKIQHLVRPVNVTLSKLGERVKRPPPVLKKIPSAFLANAASGGDANKEPLDQTVAEKIKRVLQKQEAMANEPKLPAKVEDQSKPEPPTNLGTVKRKLSRESSTDGDESATSKKKQSGPNPDRKLFSHVHEETSPKKPFLPKFKKERKLTTSANAFSPENESSVYAFESDAETSTPVTTPFRRKGTPKNDDPTNGLELPVDLKKEANGSFELPKSFGDLASVQVLPLDKLTTSWCSVPYSLNSEDLQKKQQQQQSSEVKNETDQVSKVEISGKSGDSVEVKDLDDDNDGQLFYIPLQAVTRHGSGQGQQLIQGVAVKLDTEGPQGPNQRVLLKAKLVTKPPVSVARCPPIGTVQPTARNPQSTETEMAAPSTSSLGSVSPPLKSETYPHASKLKICDKIQEKLEYLAGLKKPEKPTKAKDKTSATVAKPKVEKKASEKPKLEKKVLEKPKVDKKVVEKPKEKKVPEKPVEAPAPSAEATTSSIKKPSKILEAPVFRPSEKEFQDPLEYIEKIRPLAEKFGICRVIPPSNFKPECKISDDMRFTAYNQFIHKMLSRWGPNVREYTAIKKYLKTQSIDLDQPPALGGLDIDLPLLYHTVKNFGGLKEVIEKKRWHKVADSMKIPKGTHDRIAKLDDIYCKYLLPYAALTREERNKLFAEVESEYMEKENKALKKIEARSKDEFYEDDSDNEEFEECTVKGRNMALNNYYRVARNVMRMWFGDKVDESKGVCPEDVQSAFWKHVVEKDRHVCVHSASIDSSGGGYGFSTAKNSPFGKHPWNLKILTNNPNSVLRYLGPTMGVTVPTLHVGMLFSTFCWYRDPHGLPWIEYLHTGAKKIWYGVPDKQSGNFRKTLIRMYPRHCKNKTIWLPSDTAMVPPDMLIENGVPLCKTVQEPGQFIIVFPKAFTSSICTGYTVSESVYFAHQEWLSGAKQIFKDIQESCEPSMFAFERLLINIVDDPKAPVEILKQILPLIINMYSSEVENRKKLKAVGLTETDKVPRPPNFRKTKEAWENEGFYECDICRSLLFVSFVYKGAYSNMYCLPHALQFIEKKKPDFEDYALGYRYSEDELNDLVRKLRDKIDAKSKKN